MSGGPHVLDITAATIAAEVIDRSHRQPVLVDFWAAWCGPCRALGPILEKLAAEFDGGFLLAKVDTDREQAVAAEYRIRSLPTVTLFRNGVAAATFAGALPEGQIRRFLAEHSVTPGGAVVWAADPAERVGQLRETLTDHPERGHLRLDLAVALTEMGELGEAAPILEALPEPFYSEARAVRARARVALNHLRNTATDHALQQAVARVLAGDVADGIDQLLDLLREQKGDDRSPAKAALVEVVHLLADDDAVRSLRRRMAAVLF